MSSSLAKKCKMVKDFNSSDGVASMGISAFGNDKRGLELTEGRRHYDSVPSVQLDWRPSLRITRPNPELNANAPLSNSILDLTTPAILNPERRGKRLIPPPKEGLEATRKLGVKVVADDTNPGLLRKDRPALELSLESYLNRKRRVPPPASSTVPRLIAEHSNGFFKGGGLVPGSSFLFQGKNDSVNRLNEGWKKFLPERPSVMRTYTEVSRARELSELSDEVRLLQEWEISVLKEYADAKFTDPDVGDDDVE